jgi:hypothetical protein
MCDEYPHLHASIAEQSGSRATEGNESPNSDGARAAATVLAQLIPSRSAPKAPLIPLESDRCPAAQPQEVEYALFASH